jgi:hypothetical protein
MTGIPSPGNTGSSSLFPLFGAGQHLSRQPVTSRTAGQRRGTRTPRWPVAEPSLATAAGPVRTIQGTQDSDEPQKKFFETPWRHDQSSDQAYSALCRAGYPPDIITEAQVREGVLKQYRALVLFNHEYSEQGLMKAYEAFA